MAAGGAETVVVHGGQAGLSFQGNNYFAVGSAPRIRWSGAAYEGIAAWRAATGQERIGDRDVGCECDPRLRAPGGGGTRGDPNRLSTLEAYLLRPDSTLIDAGLDLPRTHGIDPGGVDFFGHPFPQGGGPDIGAHEAVPTVSAPDNRMNAAERFAQPAHPPPRGPAAGDRNLIVGKWEGVNARGKKQGVEFMEDGQVQMSWVGLSTPRGRYRLVDGHTIEVDVGLLYSFAGEYAVSQTDLVLRVSRPHDPEETHYKRVQEFSFAKAAPTREGGQPP
jgi:hypothetical protein